MRPSHSPVPHLDDKVSLWQGDITQLEIDAIVNSTDFELNRGLVGFAIFRTAGYSLELECEESFISTLRMGQTKITSGHRLPAKC